MTVDILRGVLGWCAVINMGLLLCTSWKFLSSHVSGFLMLCLIELVQCSHGR